MAKNIFGLGKMLKSMGIEITGFEKLFHTNIHNDIRILGECKLNNGHLATYRSTKCGDELIQTLEVGGKKIHFQTNFKPSCIEVRSKAKKDFVDIPERETIAFVHENGKVPFKAKYKVTPVTHKYYKAPDGVIRERVDSVQELHSNEIINDTFVMPNDRLVGADGQRLRIYQRSPWMLANNHGMLSL